MLNWRGASTLHTFNNSQPPSLYRVTASLPAHMSRVIHPVPHVHRVTVQALTLWIQNLPVSVLLCRSIVKLLPNDAVVFVSYHTVKLLKRRRPDLSRLPSSGAYQAGQRTPGSGSSSWHTWYTSVRNRCIEAWSCRIWGGRRGRHERLSTLFKR